MKRMILLPLLLVVACGAPHPSFERTGTLLPGATILVNDTRGDINAYAPKRGQPTSEYTIAAFAPGGSSGGRIRETANLLRIDAIVPGTRYLIRGPKGAVLDLNTRLGTINVADFDGIVNAHDDRGDIKMLLPQYGNASVGVGNMSIIFGSAGWPGTLHFSALHGDVEIYVNATANARIHLHTDHGTIFTDFPLKGISHGHNETIDGILGAGASRAIRVNVVDGSIRILQLRPQI